MKYKIAGSLAFTAIALVGCGGTSSTSSANVRAINAEPGLATATVSVGATILPDNIAYGSYTGYSSVGTGGTQQVIVSSGGSQIAQTSASIGAGASYTAYVSGTIASPSVMVLQDDNSTLANTKVRFHAVNLSPTVGSVDVYVTAPGVSLSTVAPVISSESANSDMAYTTPTTSTGFVVSFTRSGSKTALAQYSAGVVSGGKISRLLLLDSSAAAGSTQQIVSISDN